ncbi:IclR family transcriptional regulator [Planococcus shenhongbingii]|uniref:IclR family transcriptional regulator n=1 Tax=Planococcus shenhongbingii TaxID=3058398 RepID=A0ABT8NC28_9BACL|nr:IclR family transcriptional regulator [Planococcus sp. N017]MDN7245242.1 IclR family transcriptional regulator [Planococcus sp. N017]
MQSIDRAMGVIKILVDKAAEDGMAITELSNECDLPVSSMHRVLKSMSQHGMIQQDPKTKRYNLGNIWLEYGLHMYDTMDYTSKIRPELVRLTDETEESVYLSQPMGSESLIIERIDNEKHAIRVYDKLGSRIPMHIGAANKAMLAHMPTAEVKKILNQYVSKEQQPAFWDLLEAIKQRGCAISHGERTEGTVGIGAPILNHFGQVQGAVSVGVVSYNLTEERLKFLTGSVRETGRRISAKLGYSEVQERRYRK